ncbi:hypothetical protein BWQ96_04246 [Gracilariopsis chorda]|uniref:Uncharacterized protein n=1 Tax=Gracilariopsis chorda TaxID=448386 RepID=A0A2V3IXX5_9FLOR|nr:hypothetical protein BWQ96_04246 [Gracilariopsis chorda]|eukprot:PXF45990.1 hypothetical protein BWQ96_04246 [Gracilariopsis chorda]
MSHSDSTKLSQWNLEAVPNSAKCKLELPLGKTEVYTCNEVPDSSMYLVQKAKFMVTKNLSLDKVVTDLDMAADLIYLAYNATAGFAVTASVSKRQFDLASLCNKSYIAMNAFQQNCTNVLSMITDAFSQILDLRENQALIVFQSCAEYAGKMSNDCDSLATSFGSLKDDIVSDAKTVEEQISKEEVLITSLTDTIASVDSNLAQQKQIRDQLKSTIGHLQQAIEDETARQEAESDREFAAAIVKVAANAISAGLGSFSEGISDTSNERGNSKVDGANTGIPDPKNTVSQPDKSKTTTSSTNTPTKTENPQIAEAKKDVDAKQNIVIQQKTVVNMASQRVEADQEVVNSMTNDAEKRFAQETLDDGEKRLKAEQDRLKQVQGELAKAEDKLKSLQASEEHTTGDTTGDKERGKGQDALPNSTSTDVRIALIGQKRQDEALEQEAIVKIGVLNGQLAVAHEQESLAHSAVIALQIAIWAMVRIFNALQSAKMFWDSMSQYCKRLGSNQIGSIVDADMNIPEKVRTTVYHSVTFLRPAIWCVVQWKALENVCLEYKQAAEGVSSKVNMNISDTLSTREAMAALPQLQADMQGKLDEQAKAAAKYDTELSILQHRLEQGGPLPVSTST